MVWRSRNKPPSPRHGSEGSELIRRWVSHRSGPCIGTVAAAVVVRERVRFWELSGLVGMGFAFAFGF